MKKYLLSAVFLTATFPLNAMAQTKTVEAFDQPVELQLGGYMTWYGIYANQQKSTTVGATEIGKYNKFDIMGNAEIYFSGSTTLQNGTKIGVMVQLEAGTDSDTSDQTIDETYLTVDSKIGRVIVGNVKNVSNQMAVTAPNVSTLGVQETDFRRVILDPAGFSYNKATYATLDDISTKLSYITPTFSGFTAGVSLMPGNKKKGKDDNNLLNGNNGIKLFQYGADAAFLYQEDFGKFNIEASADYTVYKPNLHANGNLSKEKNINEYGAGLNIGFGNWTIGGSYHHTKMSRETAAFMNTRANIADGDSWDAGIKYGAGPFEVSATAFQSYAKSLTVNNKRDLFSMYQLSGKYKILAGMDVFTDIAYLDFDSASANRSASNKSSAVAVGMNLNF